MAQKNETESDEELEKPNNFKGKNEDSVLECAVCLQPSIYPVQLPCSHVFCFLCVKGEKL